MSQPGTIFHAFDRCTDFFTALSPLFDLGVRFWIAQVFFTPGLVKIQSWSITLGLFESEYKVPLLPPAVAALLGTAAELTLPVLIAFGLVTRLSSLALFLFNLVAVYAYGSFLFSAEGAAGLQQHILWGALLAMLVFHGPGRLSLDHRLLHRNR